MIATGKGGSAGSTQSVSVAAGIPQKVWDRTFGGSAEDRLYKIVATTDGGYLLGGFSYSNASESKSENGKGDRDFWVIKITAIGTKQWDKTYGGSGEDDLSFILPTADGGFLLGGNSSSNVSGDKSENSRGGLDYWVIKIGANGAKQWDKTFGGNSTEYLRPIISTIDSGYLLVGCSFSNASGEKTENSKGKFDIWLVKIGPNGEKQWDKTYGGNEEEVACSVVATPDGGFLVGARSFSNASSDKLENNRGSFDWWVIKIGTNGTKQWDRTYGGNGWEDIFSIVATNDGSFLLGGRSYSPISGEKSEEGRGGDDYWLLKVSANGVKQWDKTYGGNQWDYLETVVATTDGGYLLGGSSFSDISGDKSENTRGGLDWWIVKVAPNGAKQWDRTLGGNAEDALYAIVPTADGGFLLGGASSSPSSGDKLATDWGSHDYWIIKVK
ncbi:lipoprotein [Nibrella saemangeumensis]|uniref:Lipoprotein n=2 Tax=Nibrella saemangeumensis TaxID=1084526 RepID=A0ABP8MJE8_9BACT